MNIPIISQADIQLAGVKSIFKNSLYEVVQDMREGVIPTSIESTAVDDCLGRWLAALTRAKEAKRMYDEMTSAQK